MSALIQRDVTTVRSIHKLLWKASMAHPASFIIWLGTKPLASLIFHIIIPFQIAYALQAIIAREFNAVYDYAYTVLILAVIYCILWWVGGTAIAKNVEYGMNYLQRVVLKNFLYKDYEFFTHTHVGSLGAQVAQLRMAFNNYSTMINGGVGVQAVIVLASVAIIAWQSLFLAVITLVAMAFILSFTVVSMKWRIKYRQVLSEVSNETNGVVGDVLTHATTVKSFAAENYEENRLGFFFRKLSRSQYRSWSASVLPDVGIQFLSAATTVALLILTAVLYQDSVISIAIVLLVQLYVIKLIAATGGIADLFRAYDDIMTTAYKAAQTLLIAPTVVNKAHLLSLPAQAVLDLQFHNVTYSYHGSNTDAAVQDFALHIKCGEKIGLVGYSGSGKTTVTKLALRFMDISDGKITIAGTDIRDVSQSELRRCIAYVPQEPLLFHRSVIDNIAYGNPTATQEEMLAASRAAYVHEFIDDLPQGYDTMVGEKGIRLSGGQRQRIAIARAILKNAPILILDEATSALDSHSEQYIQQALWELMKGRTTLVIAHRLSTIQKMDRIVVMDKGRITEVGSHNELLSSDTTYAQLWTHQRAFTEVDQV